MVEVPGDPEAFFAEYLPARFAEVADAVVGQTSVGSLTFRVLDAGEWSLRLFDGRLEVARGMDDDVVLQATVSAEDFEPLVVDSARRGGEPSSARAGQGALRALALDAETARLLRHVPGSVLFAVQAEVSRRLLITPGRRAADLADAECTIHCAQEDFLEMQSGRTDPTQLFVAGKLRLSGNVQIALALGGVFG